MSTERVRIAIAVDDAALAERLAAMLGGVEGIEIATPGEEAHASLVAGERRAADSRRTSLTHREAEVLALLAEGASNKTIARRLGISVHTAKFHVASVIDKLDATGRTDAVAHAARTGVIQL